MVKSFLSEKDSNKPVEAGFHDVCSILPGIYNRSGNAAFIVTLPIFCSVATITSHHTLSNGPGAFQVICVLDGHGNDGHWPAMRMTVTWVSEKSDREW